MKTKLPLIIIMICVINSCKKDVLIKEKPPGLNRPTIINTVGSWWVYDWVEYDRLGNSHSLHIRDSVYVIGDTSIDNISYVQLDGTYHGNRAKRFLRDSSIFIIERGKGIIYSFSKDPYRTTYRFFDYTQKFEHQLVSGFVNDRITTPAGTYNGVISQVNYKMTDLTRFTVCDSILSFRHYWVNGIGEVLRQDANIAAVKSRCIYEEQQLVKYYIEVE